MTKAYYNEICPEKAAVIRELIRANVVAPGDVDERSITDVSADDVRGYTQCHWFAGFGVWSYALRLAGWADDRAVWTGSCPCPPFSVAGKKKRCPACQSRHLVPHVGRTGYFVCCLCQHEWFADGRHLLPELWRLVRDGRPGCLFGEQVAGDDGVTWFVSVRASLEILRYTARVKNLNAAGFGAPHIRQRLFFCADTEHAGHNRPHGAEAVTDCDQPEVRMPDGDRAAGISSHAESGRLQQHDTSERTVRQPNEGCESGQLPYTESERLREARSNSGRSTERAGNHGEPIERSGAMHPERRPLMQHRDHGRDGTDAGRSEAHGKPGTCGEVRDNGNTSTPRLSHSEPEDLPGARRQAERRAATEPGQTFGERIWRGPGWLDPNVAQAASDTGATRGFWADCDWWYGRDGKYRPIGPGIFPLAHGVANRVLKLRGYGDAINAEVAKAFIAAYMEATEDVG